MPIKKPSVEVTHDESGGLMARVVLTSEIVAGDPMMPILKHTYSGEAIKNPAAMLESRRHRNPSRDCFHNRVPS